MVKYKIMPRKKKPKFTDVQHHQHARKRVDLRKFEATLIDRLVFIAGPMIPIAIAPTAYDVWFSDGAEGVTLTTWMILSCTSLVMAWYAVLHKEKALVLTYIPLFFLNLSVVVGVLVQG